jgi:WD40 repeat protein
MRLITLILATIFLVSVTDSIKENSASKKSFKNVIDQRRGHSVPKNSRPKFSGPPKEKLEKLKLALSSKGANTDKKQRLVQNGRKARGNGNKPDLKLIKTIENLGYHVTFNNAGLMATSDFFTGSVTIWQVDTLRSSNIKSFTFNTGHNAPITATRFEKNGRLATGDADGNVKVWDVSLNSATQVNDIGGLFVVLDFSFANGFLWVTEIDGVSFLFDLDQFNGDLVYTITSAPYSVISVLDDRDTPGVLVSFLDQLYSHYLFSEYFDFLGFSESYIITLANSNLTLSTGDEYGNSVIYRKDKDYCFSRQATKVLTASNQDLILTQIYDSSGLLYSSAGALTVIYDAATGLEEQVLSEHTDQIIDSAYDNQSELFATQSVDGTVKLWARNFGSAH